MLRSMHMQREQPLSRRPQTAATTSKFDESRIKDKLKFLEDIENKLSYDIAKLQEEEDKPTVKKGVRVTREMILKAAMVDSAAEVSAVMLRDHNIEVFDDNRTQQFSLD